MYIDGKKFSALFSDPKSNHDEICEGIYAIAQHLVQKFHATKRRLHMDDADLEDMASFATMTGIRKINHFDPNCTDNAFSYFTTVVFNAMRGWLKVRRNHKDIVDSYKESGGGLSHRSKECDDEPIMPMTVHQVCERLGIGESTLNTYRNCGLINAVPGWRQDKYRFLYDEYNVAKLEKLLNESKGRHFRYATGIELQELRVNTINSVASKVGIHVDSLHAWIRKGVLETDVIDGQHFIKDSDIEPLKELIEQASARTKKTLAGIRMIQNGLMSSSEAADALGVHIATLHRWVNAGIIIRRDDNTFHQDEVARFKELLLQFEAIKYIDRSRKYFTKHVKLGNITHFCSFGDRKWYAKWELDRFVAQTNGQAT